MRVYDDGISASVKYTRPPIEVRSPLWAPCGPDHAAYSALHGHTTGTYLIDNSYFTPRKHRISTYALHLAQMHDTGRWTIHVMKHWAGLWIEDADLAKIVQALRHTCWESPRYMAYEAIGALLLQIERDNYKQAPRGGDLFCHDWLTAMRDGRGDE